MAQVNDMTNLNSYFKNAYASKIEDLVPDNTYFAKEAQSLPAESQPGGNYTLPVTLSSEEGVTLASSAAGAFALESPEALTAQTASLAGSQLLLRSALDYETIFRSRNKNAFIRATKAVVENMIKSAYFYQEALMMWGKQGLGTIASVSTNTLVITTAEYASGLWLGSEGRKLRIQTSGGVLRGTCKIVSYDISARSITVDAAPAGTAATDVIFFGSAGASGANEMTGIHKIITNTGTLFGIDAASYNLWKSAGTFSAGSAPVSFNKILLGIAQGVNKGLGDDVREIDVIVNPVGWQNMANDQSAMRQYDASYKSSEVMTGSEAIQFFCQAGKVNIISHKMMKEGYAWILPKCSRTIQKVGTNPSPTFELPGMTANGEKQYLRTMENNAGVETRIYWNCAVFTPKIHQTVLINNIVNSAS